MRCANKGEKLEKLSREIEGLRKQLSSLYEKYNNNHHPKVLGVSRVLDQKIIEYLQLSKDV